MQDRPTAQELVEAVADFIGRELAPALSDQRLRFRALIAASVLEGVARELAAGDEPLRAEWLRLAALLGSPEREPPPRDTELRDAVRSLARELCARIRRGDYDDHPLQQEALRYAEASVSEKLRVANPRFLAHLRP